MVEATEMSGGASRVPEGGGAAPPVGAHVSTMGWLSFFTMFVIGTDTFLVAPLLPLLQRELAVPLSRAGWLVSAYALGYALFALVAGPVSDRHDRRRVILSGLAAFAVFTCACGLAWSFWSMVAARFLAGVSAAFVSSQIWASIPMTVPRTSIIKVMGYATAGLAVAQVAGVPIGSYLSVRGWQLPFFVVAAVSVVLWGLLCAAFPHVRPVGEPVDVVGSYRRILGSRVLRWSLLAYLAFQTGNYASFSFIGSWLAKDFGASQTIIGKAMMMIGLGTALGSLLGSRLVARIGERRSLWAGILVQGAFYLLAAAMPLIAHTMWGAVIAFAAALVVAGFLLPVLMGQLQAHAGQARGTVSSLSNTAMYLGATIAGAVGGDLLVRLPGFWGPSLMTAFAFLLAVALYRIAGALASE